MNFQKNIRYWKWIQPLETLVCLFLCEIHIQTNTHPIVDSCGFIQCQFIFSTFIQSTLTQPAVAVGTLYQAISIFLNPFIVCGTGGGGWYNQTYLEELEGWFLKTLCIFPNLLPEKVFYSFTFIWSREWQKEQK